MRLLLCDGSVLGSERREHHRLGEARVLIRAVDECIGDDVLIEVGCRRNSRIARCEDLQNLAVTLSREA